MQSLCAYFIVLIHHQAYCDEHQLLTSILNDCQSFVNIISFLNFLFYILEKQIAG